MVVQVFGGLLIIAHLGLATWAAVGWAELAFDSIPWTRVSNPLFSPAMRALQWSLITLAAATFITGYLTRWRRLPWAMLGIYAAMAAVCAWQTFFILTDAGRFRAMAIEYAEYTVILLFLFGSAQMRARFGR